MFRLAHFSDLHLGPLPDVTYRELVSKRITGYVNWQRRRSKSLQENVIDRVVADMLDARPDHIALTGDLVNLALDKEIDAARIWLETLGSPSTVSVVPGNHDAYVPGALDKACKAWGPWMTGDDGHPPKDRTAFPYMRRRGPVALIGVSSARATVPFMANGYFREKQARKVGKLLDKAREQGLFRVVMIHHPPVRGAAPTAKRLFGITLFQKTMRKHGAELVLHGHTHLPTLHFIAGPDGEIPVVGVAAAGQSHGHALPAAQYNLFEISGSRDDWRVVLTRRGVAGLDAAIHVVSREVLRETTAAPASEA